MFYNRFARVRHTIQIQHMRDHTLIKGSILGRGHRLFAILVIFSLLFAPAEPVLAFGTGEPTIPNASVFTKGGESSKVEGTTGAFTYRIPFDIPPGRNELQPDVALEYNSQNTSDGIVGYGWSLSVPYIQRLNKTGSENLYGNTPYFTSSIDGELAVASTTSSTLTATSSTPSILDTLPLTLYTTSVDITSDSRSYTVPSSGTNKVFMFLLAKGCDGAPTATLNSVSLTVGEITGTHDRACYYYGYLPNPTTGTFQINYPSAQQPYYTIFTLQNAAQSGTVDVSAVTNNGNQSSKSTSVTTTVGSDLLLSFPTWETASFSSS